MTAYERTGWRDEEVSGRHREWGFNCPAVDLDFLMVEYNLGAPVAVVEYKHHRARMPDLKHPTYRALCDLADNYSSAAGPLPFILAFYWPEIWAFKVYPVNGVALEFYKQASEFDGRSILLTERRYVRSLYALRRIAVDKRVINRLMDELPAPAEAA